MNFSGLTGPVNSEAAEPVASAKEVRLEEKSITRLVDPPFFSTDTKELTLSGRLNKRTIEMTCSIVVCLLAFCCCLFAKGQNDRLEAELARLNHSYNTEATWENVDRMRLERELRAARRQLEALTVSRDIDSAQESNHSPPVPDRFRQLRLQYLAPEPFMKPPMPAPIPHDFNSNSDATSSSTPTSTSTFGPSRIPGFVPRRFLGVEQ
jgi:hypothetical protein